MMGSGEAMWKSPAFFVLLESRLAELLSPFSRAIIWAIGAAHVYPTTEEEAILADPNTDPACAHWSWGVFLGLQAGHD